ncbi:hypothetical protein WJX73_008897 [Symbiochloris irregularis]|uniref:Serine/threonine-protein phosphatase 4 regulatory subunit 2 n=1 Tax=Symbiochloris irregularis TaxID=706552 RepID=A0AAW1NRR2_9CHLO
MGERVASLDELRHFYRTPPAERRVSAALRGVLAEIATTARLRYDWKDIRPLIRFHIESVLTDMEAETQVEVGPARPMEGGVSPADFKVRLGDLLTTHDNGTPFTVQRLCEVLLEPRKQYSQFEALALAIEKLLLVTTLARVRIRKECSEAHVGLFPLSSVTAHLSLPVLSNVNRSRRGLLCVGNRTPESLE